MKAAEDGERDDLAHLRRLHGPRRWRVLPQGEVGARAVGVVQVRAQDAAGNALATTPNNKFTIDNTRPTLDTLTYNKSSKLYRAELFTVTAVFSEDITPSTPAISISGSCGS